MSRSQPTGASPPRSPHAAWGAVPQVLSGARLQLRRSQPDDAGALHAAIQEPEVMRHLDWPAPRSPDDTRSYLQGCAMRWSSGTEHHWVIEPRGGGGLLGTIAMRPHLRPIPDDAMQRTPYAVDLGFLLARPAWGQGLGTEAGQLLTAWLRRQAAVWRVWATTDAQNHRSAALLERLGMRLEGRLRRATVRPQLGPDPRDTLLYAWCRDDPT